MFANIVKFITQSGDVTLFSVIAVLLLVAFLAYGRFNLFLGQWKERGGLFEDWRKTIPKLEISIDLINTKLKDIGDDIKDLQKEQPTSPNVLTQRSPIALNDKGQKISDAINAEQIVLTSLDKYLQTLLPEQLENPYDIQEKSFDYMNDFSFDDKTTDMLKRVAYDEGVSMLDVKRILGVVLRDKILEKRGFSPNDVDEHTPDS